MKKLKVMLTVICVSIACLLLLTACAAKLSAPAGFRLDADTLTLHWNKVKGAATYTVEITGQPEISTRDNFVSLEELEPGDYVIRVKATVYGNQYDDSDYAEYKFTREKESGLKYKLTSTRDAYELIGVGTATGDVVMEDYFRGKPVTGIAKAALRRTGRITSFVVGKNVKTIGDSAFASCASMTSIVIPEGVVSIGEGAFQSCSSLQTVTLPNSLKSISPYCFSMCKALETINVGTDVNSIGMYAFADCLMLKEIEISDGVETIGEYAFSGCTELSNVRFGNNLKNIERFAFFKSTALRSVSFNNQLQSIGEGAFQLGGLTSVTLPDSVTTVGVLAFGGCSALEEINLGTGIRSMGASAFTETAFVNNYEGDVIIAGSWILAVKNLEIENYTTPEEITGIADGAFRGCDLLERINMTSVQYIGQGAFSGCDALWEVVISEAGIEIGDYAFSSCKVLWAVSLAEGLQTIGNFAFAGCINLNDTEDFNIPKSVTTIGRSAFEGTRTFEDSKGFVYFDDWLVDCTFYMLDDTVIFIKEGTRGISNYACHDLLIYQGVLYIPNSVETIGRGAFYNNTMLISTNLPTGLKYIGDYAFSGCVRLAFGEYGDTVIPYGCEYIGGRAFMNCKRIINLSIPGSVKYIGDGAFKNCWNIGFSQYTTSPEPNAPNIIGDLMIAEGVEHIGDQVFYGCYGLQTVKIPDSVTEIGNRVFYKCERLENVTFGAGMTQIPEYSFYGCIGMKELNVPGNIRTIGKYAFRGCTALKKITLSDGVETVEKYAFFKNTGVEYLAIADSVTYIGDFAFRNMERIKAIYFHDNISYVGKMAFYGANKAVFYFEGDKIPETWAPRWNIAYNPIVFGAKLSEDNGYIVSWSTVDGKLDNLSGFVEMSAPGRSGYTFAGWSTVENDIAWKYADLTEVPADTTVYSVWTEGEPEEIPEENPEETPGETTAPAGNSGAMIP